MPAGGPRREFAEDYVNALVMAAKAQEMGLDKGSNFEEQMRIARIRLLAQDLKQAIQARSSQVPQQDIENYYEKNKVNFEEAELDRIYIPKKQQLPPASDQQHADANHSQNSDLVLKDEAEKLRARAVEGADFGQLQADAFLIAGIKNFPPYSSMKSRRTSFPPSESWIFDIKLGEVSPVVEEANAYVIYKVKSKDTIPFEQAQGEIKSNLRSQRMRDEMDSIVKSATPSFDNSYFRRRPPNQGVPKAGETKKSGSEPSSQNPN
jgi:hypothetical protein